LELYLGVANGQLRYFNEAGEMAPTPTEAAKWEQQQTEQERQRAEQERQRAEQERQWAERLAQRLREMGVEPESLRQD
jgi:hypothetical protein